MAKYTLEHEDNDLIVICGECNTRHKFEMHVPNVFFLDNAPFTTVLEPEPVDEFQLDGGIMHPEWVCRNFRCENHARIYW